jgi:hypothetical protein
VLEDTEQRLGLLGADVDALEVGDVDVVGGGLIDLAE